MGQLKLTASLLLLALLMAGAGPAAEPPTLVAEPQATEYADGGNDRPQVLVVFRNKGGEPLYDVRLTPFPAAYEKSVIEPSARLAELAPSGEVSWTVTLPATLPRPIPDALRLRAGYETGDAGRRVGHVLTTSVAVSRRKPESVADVATVALSGESATIQDGQTLNFTLSVENKSDTPVQIVSVAPPSVDRYLAVPAVIENPPTVEPGHVGFVTIPVTAAGEVPLGKRTLTLQAELRWGPAGQPSTGTAVVSQELTLAVAGASEVLTTLSVPSLLLLPGYLIVLCYLLAASWGTPQPAASSLQLWKDVAKPGTLVISLTLSFAMVWAYNRHWHQNIAVAYGWSDVRRLWLLSMVVGGGAGMVVLLWRTIQAERRSRDAEALRRDIAATAYAESDTPEALLRKLALNGGTGCRLAYADLKVGAATTRFYRLAEKYPQPDRAWVAPKIQVGNALAGTGSEELQAAINKPETVAPGDMASLLKQGAEGAGWAVVWAESRTPLKVEADAFQRAADAGIVELG